MRNLGFCFSMVVLLLGACQGMAQVKPVSNQQLSELIENDNLQLVDVRTPQEVSEGKIGEAQNIDFRSPGFKEAISQLDRSKPVAVYCGAGKRSGQASTLLKDLGFTEIYDLTGGFSQWKAEDYPVTMPAGN